MHPPLQLVGAARLERDFPGTPRHYLSTGHVFGPGQLGECPGAESEGKKLVDRPVRLALNTCQEILERYALHELRVGLGRRPVC